MSAAFLVKLARLLGGHRGQLATGLEDVGQGALGISTPPNQPERLFVDALARAHRDDFDCIRGLAIDNAGPPDTEAAESRQVRPEGLAGRRLGDDPFQGRAHAALEIGVQTAEQQDDIRWKPEAARPCHRPAAGSNSSSRV